MIVFTVDEYTYLLSLVKNALKHVDYTNDTEYYFLANLEDRLERNLFEVKILNLDIKTLNLSARTDHALRRAGIKTIGDLTSKTADDIKIIRTLGEKSFAELSEKMKQHELTFAKDNKMEKFDYYKDIDIVSEQLQYDGIKLPTVREFNCILQFDNCQIKTLKRNGNTVISRKRFNRCAKKLKSFYPKNSDEFLNVFCKYIEAMVGFPVDIYFDKRESSKEDGWKFYGNSEEDQGDWIIWRKGESPYYGRIIKGEKLVC